MQGTLRLDVRADRHRDDGAVLPLRGFLAGTFIEHWGVRPVQALDGIGAGLQNVAVPGLVARLLAGTGRVNVGGRG